MAVARRLVADVLRQMRPEEGCSVVLFDHVASVLQPHRSVDALDIERVCAEVVKTEARGGTDMLLGLKAAFAELQPATGAEKRILFLTDAMPNTGGGAGAIEAFSREAAGQGVHTTYVGVGLDFDSDLATRLSRVRGGNYFSVQSEAEFAALLRDEFNYIVTPQVFDVEVDVVGANVLSVHGASEPDEKGAAVRLTTVTAGPTDPRGLKGGLVLCRLDRPCTGITLRYTAPPSEDGFVLPEQLAVAQETPVALAPLAECPAIAKGVLLRDYVQQMNAGPTAPGAEQEQEHSLRYFRQYFAQAAAALEDAQLEQELTALDRLLSIKAQGKSWDMENEIVPPVAAC